MGMGYSITPMPHLTEQREVVPVGTARASWWSVTINNPTPADFASLKKENLPSWVKFLKGQDEIGKNGTPHLQFAVQTAQVRHAAMRSWLPRAHIEIARDKVALLKYVEKTDTAVPGTQVTIQADYLAMDSALKAIAVHAMDWDEWRQRVSIKAQATDGAFEKDEFWQAVNKILRVSPKQVGLYTNPQLERAWVKTRAVWIDLLEKDRQTDRQQLENTIEGEEISPVEVYDATSPQSQDQESQDQATKEQAVYHAHGDCGDTAECSGTRFEFQRT